MSRLRVLLGVVSLDLGGAERQVTRLSVGLAALGQDVAVMALDARGPLVSALEDEGITVLDVGLRRPLGRRRDLLRLGSLPSLFRRWAPDVVHAFTHPAYVSMLPAAALAGVPLRVSGHRDLGIKWDASPVGRGLERISNRATHLAIANSRAVADVVFDHGFPRRSVEVIPNGIAPPSPASNVTAARPRGVVVANLLPGKGHADLLDALSMLPQPPEVDFVGEGPERVRLEEQRDSLGLAESVRFLGHVPEPLPLLQSAQFAILPSHHEGSPNAVLEAMAVGLPVIATAVGGTPELMDNGITGILVAPRDPTALAAAIEHLCDDPALRSSVGSAARRSVAESHDLAKVAGSHVAVYEKWLSRCSR